MIGADESMCLGRTFPGLKGETLRQAQGRLWASPVVLTLLPKEPGHPPTCERSKFALDDPISRHPSCRMSAG